MSNGTLILDDDDKPVLGGWDAVGHQVASLQVGPVFTDSMTNAKYASLALQGGYAEQANLTAGSLTADLVPSTDVSAYKWLSLQISGTWSGVLTFQASNNTTIWNNLALQTVDAYNTSAATLINTSINSIFTGPINFRYLRVRMTSYTSGTANGTLELYTSAAAMTINDAYSIQGGTWTVQPGNTANTTPWLQNVGQWNGSVPSVSNPVITEDQIRWWITNGQGFSGSTGKLTGVAGTLGLSIFNPNASGKTLIIFSLTTIQGQTHFDQINYTTSDPALGTTVTPVNLRAGNGTTSVTVCSSANTNVTPAGTVVDAVGGLANQLSQVIASGGVYILPANNGIAYYMNSGSANQWNVTFHWVEI